MEGFTGRNAISSICGSFRQIVPIIAKVREYAAPPDPPKRAKEFFSLGREQNNSEPLIDSLVRIASLISELESTVASLERKNFTPDVKEVGSKSVSSQEALLITGDSAFLDPDQKFSTLIDHPFEMNIETEDKSTLEELIKVAEEQEKQALKEIKNLLTDQAESCASVVREKLKEASDMLIKCIKQFEFCEDNITKVLECAESSHEERDYINLRDAATFLFDVRESIRMSELLADRDELLESAQIIFRTYKLFSTQQGCLLDEIANTEDIVCLRELKLKLNSVAHGFRKKLIRCLLHSIYTGLYGQCEASGPLDKNLDPDNTAFIKKYISEIAPILMGLGFDPAAGEEYSKMMMDACVYLPHKLYEYITKTGQLELDIKKHENNSNTQENKNTHGSVVVSSFEIIYSSIVTFFDRVRYTHSCMLDSVHDSQKEYTSAILNKVSNDLENSVDTGLSELLWSSFNSSDHSLSIREKAKIAILTQDFLCRCAKSSFRSRVETTDVLITCLNSGISDYQQTVLSELKLNMIQSFDNSISDGENITASNMKSQPSIEYRSKKELSYSLDKGKSMSLYVSKNFSEVIDNYVYIVKNVDFIRVNALNKLKELLKIVSYNIVETMHELKDRMYTQSLDIIFYIIEALTLVLNSISCLKNDIGALLPINQNFLLSDFDILERKYNQHISNVKGVMVDLFKDEFLKSAKEWKECHLSVGEVHSPVRDSREYIMKMQKDITRTLEYFKNSPCALKEEIYTSILHTCIQLILSTISGLVVFSIEEKIKIVSDIDILVDTFNEYEYTKNLAYGLQVCTSDLTISIRGRAGSDIHIPLSNNSGNVLVDQLEKSLSKSRCGSITSTIIHALDGILKKDMSSEKK